MKHIIKLSEGCWRNKISSVKIKIIFVMRSDTAITYIFQHNWFLNIRASDNVIINIKILRYVDPKNRIHI